MQSAIDYLRNPVHAAQWNFVNLAPQLATRPLLILTSDDGLSAPNDALVAAVGKSEKHTVKAIHFPTDHAYSDHRIALQEAVLDFFASREGVALSEDRAESL
ncbi:hypothetical protein ACOBR2_13230 [Telmatobacter bradus]|uniref:hypothetical protein n=1 Tax=Telmatobacter bradus TaxID=474953 RepID=UPI003B4338F7